MRVGAGQVEHGVGAKTAVQFDQSQIQSVEVGRIARAVGQTDVQIARHFAERKVLLAVDRQRKHRIVACKDAGRAVALVHVEVDHRHARRSGELALRHLLALQHARRHGDVVEHAIPAARISTGVVRAAGQIGRHALALRHARGLHARADRAARAIGHRLAPRKADFALRTRRQRAARHGVDVGRCVRQRQVRVGGGFGLIQNQAGAFLRQSVAQALVLAHRKAVPRRQRQHELSRVESLHQRALKELEPCI